LELVHGLRDVESDRIEEVGTIEGGVMVHRVFVAKVEAVLAGGLTGIYPDIHNSCVVEIRDVNSGSSVIQNLYRPTAPADHLKAVLKDNKIAYIASGSDHFDIYDITTGTWTIGVLHQPIPGGASIISVNNVIYVAGGSVNGVLTNEVWKLEF
jgi:hypothetical protein